MRKAGRWEANEKRAVNQEVSKAEKYSLPASFPVFKANKEFQIEDNILSNKLTQPQHNSKKLSRLMVLL